MRSPVASRHHVTVPMTYKAAVSWNTVLKELVASTMNPTAVTPIMPAKEPKVLHRPNIFPAWRGAMSDMFATKPACPREVVPSAMVMSVTATCAWKWGRGVSALQVAFTWIWRQCKKEAHSHLYEGLISPMELTIDTMNFNFESICVQELGGTVLA